MHQKLGSNFSASEVDVMSRKLVLVNLRVSQRLHYKPVSISFRLRDGGYAKEISSCELKSFIGF